MKYKVVQKFVDLQDNNFAYGVGDEFPRAGKEVTQERIDELSSNNNRRRTALIAPTEATESSLSCAGDVGAGSCGSEPKKRKKSTKKSKE